MTIERISFPEGMKLEGDPKKQVLKIIREQPELITVLVEGDYDLTPTWWTKHLHTHNLTVLGNGTALYRPTPRDSDVGLGDLKTKGFKKGGAVMRIPGDQRMIMVGGPSKDLKGLAFYEIVFYTPA